MIKTSVAERLTLYKEILKQLESLVAEGYRIRSYTRAHFWCIGPVLVNSIARNETLEYAVIAGLDYNDMDLILLTFFMSKGEHRKPASDLTEAILTSLKSIVLDLGGSVNYGGKA